MTWLIILWLWTVSCLQAWDTATSLRSPRRGWSLWVRITLFPVLFPILIVSAIITRGR